MNSPNDFILKRMLDVQQPQQPENVVAPLLFTCEYDEYSTMQLDPGKLEPVIKKDIQLLVTGTFTNEEAKRVMRNSKPMQVRGYGTKHAATAVWRPEPNVEASLIHNMRQHLLYPEVILQVMRREYSAGSLQAREFELAVNLNEVSGSFYESITISLPHLADRMQIIMYRKGQFKNKIEIVAGDRQRAFMVAKRYFPGFPDDTSKRKYAKMLDLEEDQFALHYERAKHFILFGTWD